MRHFPGTLADVFLRFCVFHVFPATLVARENAQSAILIFESPGAMLDGAVYFGHHVGVKTFTADTKL